LPSTKVSLSVGSNKSCQNGRVKGVFNLVNHTENLLGWMISCVSTSRARVLVRLRALFLRERIERSLTIGGQSYKGSVFSTHKQARKNAYQVYVVSSASNRRQSLARPMQRTTAKKKSYRKFHDTRAVHITHGNEKFKAKVCKCKSVPEVCNSQGYIPITRIRIADKGRGTGTTTSKSRG
jgi:hypothetical protein